MTYYRYASAGLPLLLSSQTAAASPFLGAHLSVTGMFTQADWLVKSVMLILVAASVLTLGITLQKMRELLISRKSLTAALGQLEHAESILVAVASRDPIVAAMAKVAERELTLQATPTPSSTEAVKERVSALLRSLEAAQQRKLSRGISVLGSIGAAAPFVGLFGTVWGIMNSFIGIAQTQTTSLAVVAPGIAEALLATAFGLVAAIPAVLAFNAITRAIGGYRLWMNHAAVQVMCLLSRQLDARLAEDTRHGI